MAMDRYAGSDVSLNYMQFGDAPTTSPDIPGVGPISGRYTDRGIILLEAALPWGARSR